MVHWSLTFELLSKLLGGGAMNLIAGKVPQFQVLIHCREVISLGAGRGAQESGNGADRSMNLGTGTRFRWDRGEDHTGR